MMSIIDRFSKATTVPGKETLGTSEWVDEALLALTGWGSRIITLEELILPN